MKRIMSCVLQGAVAALWALNSGTAHADEADRRVAWFGDVHVHTQLSYDAFVFGTRRTPEDAYRYALGETIRHANGYDIALKGGPLDFYAVTDHAEYLGVLPAMNDKANGLSLTTYAQDLFSSVRKRFAVAIRQVLQSIGNGEPIPEMDNREVVRSAWVDIQSAADRFYQPDKFTTFAGFEYGSQPRDANLHRVVLFRSERRPDLPFGALDSINPERLWDWLDANRSKGMDGLAIPHNSNVSNGLMFQLTDFAGKPITRQYAETRIRNEPLVEISQVKGTSDTHPLLSPNDEWANFEIYNVLLGTDIIGNTDGSYVRQALLRGLELEKRIGVNPYKFGLIGSSDTHNSGGPIEEDRYFGKVGRYDGTPEKRRAVPSPADAGLEGTGAMQYFKWSAAGLAGVWAERNNREDIFAAMRRRETFATSGPRIKVRLFAGHNYPADIWASTSFAKTAYENGVPMGGDLRLNGKGAPTFLAHAMKDPNSAGLQRMQIIRGWVENNQTREMVYDIACARGAPNATTHRCPSTPENIDTRTCKIDPAQGAVELKITWRDPDFSAARRAFYYVRVLENPTCRWSTWEANRLGKKPQPSLPLTIQERAWSTPLWIGA